MAIARIKKIEIIGLESEKETLLRLLQRLAVVELISISQESPLIVATSISDSQFLEIEEAISYLTTLREKTGFIQGVLGLKPLVFENQIKEVLAGFDYQNFIEELSRLRKKLNEFLNQRETLLQERQMLQPWQGLSLVLDEIGFSQTCEIYLVRLRNYNYPLLLKELEIKELSVYIEQIYQDRTETYLCIIYLKKEYAQLDEILKKYQFNPVSLPSYKLTVRQRLEEIDIQLSVLNQNIETIRTRILQLAKDQLKLMIVYDYLANTKNIQQAERALTRQRYTFNLAGWIREKDIEKLKQEITNVCKDVAIFVSEPTEKTKIPVVLENHPIIQPFEFLTYIYGMPKYGELDPTPFLAPFFFLYFGLCVSDAGYGLVLVGICWWVLKRFKLGPQGLRFWRLFLLCGISTMTVGTITGSWFGNLLDLIVQMQEKNIFFVYLKKLKDHLVFFDPLKQPQRLLGIALGLGVIQVWFGSVVAAIGNIKNRRYWDVLLDQIPLLTFLFGLTGFGMVFLKIISSDYLDVFKYFILVGGIILIFTQGRSEKGMGSKLFYGIYNVYNSFSGYLSDILSYSRLWALGLVTAVMAQTINLIAVQSSQIIPLFMPGLESVGLLKTIVSSFILILIFITGHSISFLMNLLGAFVHPLRLQFVEFFSKFFKPGGDSFKPFKIEAKYIIFSQSRR